MYAVFLALYFQGQLVGYDNHIYNDTFDCYSDIDQLQSKARTDTQFEGVTFSCEINPNFPIETN